MVGVVLVRHDFFRKLEPMVCVCVCVCVGVGGGGGGGGWVGGWVCVCFNKN